MKLVALTSAALLAATTAFAGNVVYEAPVANVVEEVTTAPTGSLGGSGGWLVPAIAVVLIAAAVVAASEDDDD